MKQVTVMPDELQNYLDKYQDKIKWVMHFDAYGKDPERYLLIIVD